jgi:hypothetical protein
MLGVSTRAALPICCLWAPSHPADKSIVLQLLKAIEKGVRASPMELNPQAEGSSVLVPVPTLTQEVRQNMTKLITKAGEAAKVGGLAQDNLPSLTGCCMRVMELSPSSRCLCRRSTDFAPLSAFFCGTWIQYASSA